MECLKCEFENPEDSMFCGECGSSLDLEIICQNCGSKPPKGFKPCFEKSLGTYRKKSIL
jgi:hypothetical protein